MLADEEDEDQGEEDEEDEVEEDAPEDHALANGRPSVDASISGP